MVRVHTTQNENLQRAFAALVFYGLYKDMFRRGLRDRITHAVIFDEAQPRRAPEADPDDGERVPQIRHITGTSLPGGARLRQLGVLGDRQLPSVTADRDGRPLPGTECRDLTAGRALIDRISKWERFKGLFFAEGKSRPHALNLAFTRRRNNRAPTTYRQVVTHRDVFRGHRALRGRAWPRARHRRYENQRRRRRGDSCRLSWLTDEQIRAACPYADAHPQRVIPRHERHARKTQPHASSKMPL